LHGTRRQTEVNSQAVTRLFETLPKSGKACLRGREFTTLCDDVEPRDAAERFEVVNDVELAGLQNARSVDAAPDKDLVGGIEDA
jgi:hypothetical protein